MKIIRNRDIALLVEIGRKVKNRILANDSDYHDNNGTNAYVQLTVGNEERDSASWNSQNSNNAQSHFNIFKHEDNYCKYLKLSGL